MTRVQHETWITRKPTETPQPSSASTDRTAADKAGQPAILGQIRLEAVTGSDSDDDGIDPTVVKVQI